MINQIACLLSYHGYMNGRQQIMTHVLTISDFIFFFHIMQVNKRMKVEF